MVVFPKRNAALQ